MELSQDWRAACVSLPVRLDLSAFGGHDGQECPSYGNALDRSADAAPLVGHDTLPPGANDSHVKQEVTDITILHDVSLAFHPQLTGSADVFFGPVSFQIKQESQVPCNWKCNETLRLLVLVLSPQGGTRTRR
jgi:hypothetical protein